MTDKLSVWNGALAALGERSLASLTEDREPRYVLQEVWDRGVVRTCLQKGQWNFAVRTAEITYETSISPDFGYRYAFVKPSDWVRTVGFYRDSGLQTPNEDYTDEAGFWWSDIDTVWVRYVSDDTQWGGDFSLWPDNFTRFVETYLAVMCIGRITHAASKAAELKQALKEWVSEAKGTDAMDDSPPQIRSGSWARSRIYYDDAAKDGGSRDQLYG